MLIEAIKKIVGSRPKGRSTERFEYLAGDKFECPDDEAERLIKLGAAKAVKESKGTVKKTRKAAATKETDKTEGGADE